MTNPHPQRALADSVRTVEQDSEVTRLLREYDIAVVDEQEAASLVSYLASQLEDLGVDVEKIR